MDDSVPIRTSHVVLSQIPQDGMLHVDISAPDPERGLHDYATIKSFFSNPTVIPAETEPESKENVKFSKSDRDLLLSQQKIPDKNAKKAEPKLATDEYADTPLITKLDEKRQAKETKSLVLNWPRDVKLLQSELPSRCVDRNWELLYSTAEHGISISTFFRKVRFPFSRFKSTWLGLRPVNFFPPPCTCSPGRSRAGEIPCLF
jgi:hypothetical protein